MEYLVQTPCEQHSSSSPDDRAGGQRSRCAFEDRVRSGAAVGRLFRPLTPYSRLTALAAGLVLLIHVGCRGTEVTSAEYPRRPIKLVVPFAAGGGSDVFARMMQDAITKHDLLPEPVVIINVPGAGGTIGSRRVRHARPDGYTLLLLHEGMFTARHSGQASYGAEAFETIAGTTNATQVIAVDAASPFRDLRSLMTQAGQHSDTVVFSANIGAPSHFAGLMLEAQSPGAAFRYTQTGGGAKRFAALQGGHVDVSAFSIAEYVQFRQSGLRALALLGPERHRALPLLPTAAEQGFDVISQNMQFWWAPKGTSRDRIERVAEAIEAAMETPEVRQKLAAMNVSADVVTGERLNQEIRLRNKRIASVARRDNLSLPDFPLLAAMAVIATGVLAGMQAFRRQHSNQQHSNQRTQRHRAGETLRWHNGHFQIVTLAAATLLYLFAMQWNWMAFRWATTVYVIVIGCALGWKSSPRSGSHRLGTLIKVTVAGGFAGFVLHHLFTHILVVDLP